MKTNVKAVIFSLEGTLVDEVKELTKCINDQLKKAGFPTKTEAEIRERVGGSFGQLIRSVVPPGTTWEQSWGLIEPAQAAFASVSGSKVTTFKGAKALIDTLKQAKIKVGVISDMGQEAAEKIVKKAFGDKVDFVCGMQEGLHQKPSPDMVFKAMEALKTNHYSTVIVGNDARDAQLAKNVGVPGYMVSWGYKSRYFLENHAAKVVVDTAEELYDLIGISKKKAVAKKKDKGFGPELSNSLI